ncbi:MAG: selenide, water dikinase SelD [Saprospiraceae bacterium]|nr:selenide, water dikinase SelD [Saprospiraceae bacterium]
MYKLTQYSHGAGCGCKISPKVLDTILSGHSKQAFFSELLVGNDERDDAAVFDLGDGSALISTTDFFMPIVDDAEEFGMIASANAISDVYAMGGRPLLAIAILGWPINTIPPEEAGKVINGSKIICGKAGIPLAGGHSIDAPEPIFGLAVTGRVAINHLKKNGGAREGDLLYLTKSLGVGILSTAQKKGILLEEHRRLAPESMMKLNTIGEIFGQMEYVHAMTDVTGFGLGGHLKEMCQASQSGAEIYYEQLPLLDKEALFYYLDKKSFPGGTTRNWDSYGDFISIKDDIQKYIIADPQTSGGLLVAVNQEAQQDFETTCAQHGFDLNPIGKITNSGRIVVN